MRVLRETAWWVEAKEASNEQSARRDSCSGVEAGIPLKVVDFPAVPDMIRQHFRFCVR